MFRYGILHGDFHHDATFMGNGYSGAGYTLAEGRNNPEMVKEEGRGPIPPGMYRILPSRTSSKLGRLTFDLEPLLGTDTFGRSLFRIHGNSKDNNASHGCIVLGPTIREHLDVVINSRLGVDYNILKVD